MTTEAEKSEIRGLFRGAKSPRKQIKILQDLYQISRQEVFEILGLEKEPAHRKLKYPPEMHREVVDAVLRGESTAEVARKYGINRSTVYYWVNEG